MGPVARRMNLGMIEAATMEKKIMMEELILWIRSNTSARLMKNFKKKKISKIL